MDPSERRYTQSECGKISIISYYTNAMQLYQSIIEIMPDYRPFVKDIPIHYPHTYIDHVLTVKGLESNNLAHLFSDNYLVKLMIYRHSYVMKHLEELRECYAKLFMDYKEIESKKHTLEQEIKWLTASRDAIAEQVHGPNSNYSKAYIDAVSSMNPQAPIFVPTHALVEEAKKSGTTSRLTSSAGYWTDS